MSSKAKRPTQPISSFFRLAGGFWRGRSARLAWTLTLAAFGAMLAQIGAQVAVNWWNRVFFDALEKKSVPAISAAIGWLPFIIASSAICVTLVVITRMILQTRWREWLTMKIAGWWIADQRYYRLGFVAPEQNAPEFRIADDARISVEPLVEFVTGLLAASITAFTFAAILWQVAGSIIIPFAGSSIEIPAYMAVAAVIYALLASGAAYIAGRPLVRRVSEKNEAEAQFRAEMTRLRENAESIALIRGDRGELASVRERYATLLATWIRVIRQQSLIGVVLNTNGALFPVIPLLLVTPKYLQGDMSLGGVMQIVAAFASVQGALIWFVDNSVRVAEWYASAVRVLELTSALDELDAATQMENQAEIEFGESEDGAIRLERLAIADRAGRTVISEAEVNIQRGEKVMIAGESGTGKSTLIRALAGLWPWGSGTIRLPQGQKLAFVPQRPYIPTGSLRTAITYPEDRTVFSDERIAQVMQRCGIGYLLKQIDTEDQRWDQTLSGGERQRIAFCRLLLHKPDIIVMDEATSALDEDSQASLLALLHEDLVAATVISVGHRTGVEEYHDRKIVLERRTAGARVTSVTLPVTLWRMFAKKKSAA